MLRFAPSPTGDMHINDLRVALLNYLVAQQRHDTFTVRIVDTEKDKNIEGKDTEIMQILEKFALIHQGVFHQSEHLHIHQTLAIKLLEQGKAFVCTCEENQAPYSGKCKNIATSQHAKLKEEGRPFVVRIKKPSHSIITSDILAGDITTTAKEIDDFIILHIDGTPSKTFAYACDDMLSGITTILEEKSKHITAVRAQHIKTELGYDQKTEYIHIPKLENAPTILELFEQGYIPDAIINYLILVGLPAIHNKVFSLAEAITWFRLENISSCVVTFNIDELRFINREYLKNMDDKQLSSLFGFADADVGKLAKLYLDEANTINELALKIRPIFAPKIFEGKWKEEMKTLQTIIANAPMFYEYDAFLSYLSKTSGLKDDKLYKPLRILLTGAQQGPKLLEIYPYIKSYLLEIAS